ASEMLPKYHEAKILNLNIYCLFKVFHQIKISCEQCHEIEDKLVRYLDLINFVISCKLFTNAFQTWNPQLFYDLEIEKTFLSQYKWLEVDFQKLYDKTQQLSAKEKQLFWKSYLSAIEANDHLESIKIIYIPTRHNSEHLDRFEAFIDVIKYKRTVREFSVNIKGYSFNYVPVFGQLEILNLDARMDTETLVQLCRSNPNLRRLNLFSNQLLGGRLANIVPHCEQLEYLRFVMKWRQNAEEYSPLSRIPKLFALTIHGEHEEGSLLRLFHCLEHSGIRRISVPNVYITKEEASALVKAPLLNFAKICLPNRVDFRDLEEKNPLHEKWILKEPKLYDTDQEMLFDSEEQNRFTITVRAQLKNPKEHPNKDRLYINAQRLRCEGLYEGSISLEYYNSTNETIAMFPEKLVLHKKQLISQKEGDILASAPSLTTIRCYFSQLLKMIRVKVRQIEGLKETAGRVDRIRAENCEIQLVHDQDAITLVIAVKGRYRYTNIFAALFKLNVKCLVIKQSLIYNSFSPLYKKLSPEEVRNLQELHLGVVHPDEVTDLVKFKNLKVIKCGFFCSKNIEQLAELDQLEALTINVHPQGSLRDLFHKLACNPKQTLQRLVVLRAELTFEEITEVSNIKSLQSVQLGVSKNPAYLPANHHPQRMHEIPCCRNCLMTQSFRDNLNHKSITEMIISTEPDGETLLDQIYRPKELVHLSTEFIGAERLGRLTNLEELRIYFDYQIDDDIFRSFRKLQNLSVSSQNFEKLSQIKDLQSLQCVIHHPQGFENIALLRNISELQIHNPLGISLWELLKELNVLVNLKGLFLDNTDLEFLEMVEVMKLTWLKKLRLGLADKKFIYMPLQLKNLEDLEITSIHFGEENQLNFVLSYIVASKNLRSLTLYRFYNLITIRFVNEILMTLSLTRDPEVFPPFRLRGVWSNFK
ncbi:hypothetical protein KR018_004888, partial [Drosophila ironensis]